MILCKKAILKRLKFILLVSIFILIVKVYSNKKSQISIPVNTNRSLNSTSTLAYASQKTSNMIENQDQHKLCYLKQVNEWDRSIKDLIKTVSIFDGCIKNEPLTQFVDGQLYIDDYINRTYYDGKIVYCEYATVIRETSFNDSYTLSEYKKINQSPTQIEDEYIKVRCFGFNKNATNRTSHLQVVYEYVHFQIKPFKVDQKEKTSNVKKQFNVMILVFDSVSLLSMKRALPNTLKYLKSFNNFYLFEKHHVIGENTFQNLVPMLTGLDSELLLNETLESSIADGSKNESKIIAPFDSFPFIWKNYSQANYITYFSEEWRKSTFYSEKFGFKEQPTDYYLRPYWLALYDSLSYPSTKTNSNPKPCYYDKLLHHLSFEWLKKFEYSYSFHTDVPRFGLIKMNEMSHDNLERLFWIDEDLLQLLYYLFNIDGFVENTLLILMSDHGHRFHEIRKTPIGKLEEKLPMFSMMVPERLLNNQIRKILNENTKTLTTFWDVYETLVHLLLDQNNILVNNHFYHEHLKQQRATNGNTIKKGTSLFMRIQDRNCAEAHIPEYLCACESGSQVDTNSTLVREAAMFMLDHINNRILKNFSDICMKLNLSQIKDVQQNAKKDKLTIIFETKPNTAWFDGTVKIVSNLNKPLQFDFIGRIVRISEYGKSSDCIKNYFLKNFCYCIDFHKNSNSTKV